MNTNNIWNTNTNTVLGTYLKYKHSECLLFRFANTIRPSPSTEAPKKKLLKVARMKVSEVNRNLHLYTIVLFRIMCISFVYYCVTCTQSKMYYFKYYWYLRKVVICIIRNTNTYSCVTRTRLREAMCMNSSTLATGTMHMHSPHYWHRCERWECEPSVSVDRKSAAKEVEVAAGGMWWELVVTKRELSLVQDGQDVQRMHWGQCSGELLTLFWWMHQGSDQLKIW